MTQNQVDILLTCRHIITIPVEDVRDLPMHGTPVRCSRCKTRVKVKAVGVPYNAEYKDDKEIGVK